MKRWKIMIMALLMATAAMVGPVAPEASAASTCVDRGDCIELNSDDSTPECTICHPGDVCRFVVRSYGDSRVARTVGFVTVNETAKAGVHFAGVTDGRITIPAGDTQAEFTIQVFPGVPGTPNTIFHVVLTSVSTGTIGNGQTEVHIPGTSRLGVELGHRMTHQ